MALVCFGMLYGSELEFAYLVARYSCGSQVRCRDGAPVNAVKEWA